ncbi:MAG: ureidoglycolate lyase [Pseudomonadota bacterium]
MRHIPLHTATADALKPFGSIIGTDPSVPKLPVSFYDGHVDVRMPASFESAAPPQLTVCRIQPRPMVIDYVERHPQHTQGFVPLGGKPFVAVFAPPSEDLPTPDALRAFKFDGTCGFLMHKHVWHEFPFAVEADTDLIVILSEATNANLQEDPNGLGEAQGPDLEKLNYRTRVGDISIAL